MLTLFNPGGWYLTVFCAGCKQRIPVSSDMSEGKSLIAGGYDLACPKCHHHGSYNRDQVQHYQHPHELLFSPKSSKNPSINK